MKTQNLATPLTMLFGVTVFAMLMAVAPGISELIVAAARSDRPYPLSPQIDYIVGSIWALVLGLSILLWPVPPRHKYILLWAWGFRTIMTLGFMLVYESHYGMDNDGYFMGGYVGEYGFFQLGDGTHNVRVLATLYQYLSPSSFHATKVGFAMVGHVAVYIFYRAFSLYSRRENYRLFYFLELFPSVLLWSSLVGKDPICLLGVSLYVYGVSRWYNIKNGGPPVLIPLGILVCMFIRPWFGMILTPPMVFLVLFSNKKQTFFRLIVFLVLIIGMVKTWSVLQEYGNFTDIPGLLQARQRMARGFTLTGSGGGHEAGGSSFLTANVPNSILILVAVPAGILTALFRPFPWEARNIFSGAFALENVFLFYLLILTFKRVRLRSIDPFILWILLIISIWAAMYGLVIGNFGALSRFKLQIQPLFIFLMFHLSTKQGIILPNAANKIPQRPSF